MQTPGGPIHAALAVIVHDQAVLLIQRHDSTPDRWFLPGGRLDPGETPAQAVVREVLEETGLQVRVLKSLGQRTALSPSKNREVDLYYFICEILPGTPTQFTVQPEEIAGCEWVPVSQALTRLGPDTFTAVCEFLTNNASE